MDFEVEKAFPCATRFRVVGKRDAGSDAPAKVQNFKGAGFYLFPSSMPKIKSLADSLIITQTPDEIRQALLLPFVAAVLALHGLADFAAGKSEEQCTSKAIGSGDSLDICRTASRTFGDTIGLAWQSYRL